MLKPAFIDLSHHNTVPESLLPAREAGILGVVHKATEGASVVDKKMKARRYLALEADMLWGVYHFVRPGDMQAQAEHFLGTCKDVIDKSTLICLDYEDTAVSLDEVLEWLQYVERLTGRSPVLYSGHVLKEALGGTAAPQVLTQYRLWLAQYGSNYRLPPGYSKLWAWQYTEKGEVPGINPPTDLNAYWSDNPSALFVEWSGTTIVPEPGPEPGPTPVPGPATVTVTIVAPPGVRVLVDVQESGGTASPVSEPGPLPPGNEEHD